MLAAKIHETPKEVRDMLNASEAVLDHYCIDGKELELRRLVKMPKVLSEDYSRLKDLLFEVEQLCFTCLEMTVQLPEVFERLMMILSWLLFQPTFCRLCYNVLCDLFLSPSVVHQFLDSHAAPEALAVAVIEVCMKHYDTSCDPLFKLIDNKPWWHVFAVKEADFFLCKNIMQRFVERYKDRQ